MGSGSTNMGRQAKRAKSRRLRIEDVAIGLMVVVLALGFAGVFLAFVQAI
jgi:hypothetical protein